MKEEKEEIKREKKRSSSTSTVTLAILTVGSLIFLLLNSYTVAAAGGVEKVVNFVGGWLGDIYEVGLRQIHNIFFINYVTVGEDVLYSDLTNLITMNPPVKDSVLLKTFMQLIIPFYLLAITALGFYLIFYSGSPPIRAKAKSVLGRMVVGMIVISLTPQIWEVGLSLSENLTHQILNLVPLNVYTDLMYKYVKESKDLFWYLGWGDFTGLAFVFPLMWVWYLVWGTFGIIVLRYIAVTLWISLFPLAIFFYSFEPTRGLGRNMLEQSIIWVLIQAFFAVVIAAVVLAFINLGGNTDIYQIGQSIPGFGFLGVDFLVFTGVFMMILAPLMMTRIFRNFLPR